jgi:hypothetical protein
VTAYTVEWWHPARKWCVLATGRLARADAETAMAKYQTEYPTSKFRVVELESKAKP